MLEAVQIAPHEQVVLLELAKVYLDIYLLLNVDALDAINHAECVVYHVELGDLWHEFTFLDQAHIDDALHLKFCGHSSQFYIELHLINWILLLLVSNFVVQKVDFFERLHEVLQDW